MIGRAAPPPTIPTPFSREPKASAANVAALAFGSRLNGAPAPGKYIGDRAMADNHLKTMWAAALALALPSAPAQAAPTPQELAGRARDVLQQYCAECHGGARPRGGVAVLDHAALTASPGVVESGRPEASELLQLVRSGTMPPGDRPRPPREAVEALSAWIAGGAPVFPSRFGDAYVLARILEDQRALKPHQNPQYQRYVSFNHLLADAATAPSPETCRAALASALNHLSRVKDPARPVALPGDPTRTIFRFDLRQLGWESNPFKGSTVNYYDLLLLEYPFAVIPKASESWAALEARYLGQEEAPLVRPIAYVRGDWLVTLATQPPLYEDLLELPRTLLDGRDDLDNRVEGLLTRLGVKRDGDRRAGLLKMHEIAGNRIVERRESARGPFYRTYELPNSKGEGDLLKKLKVQQAGGLVLFGLPNGLMGSALFDEDGRRLEAAPVGWLTDPNAPGQGGQARNGLSCMRCHTMGPRTFTDRAHAALQKSDLADKETLLKQFVSQDEWENKLVGVDARRCGDSLDAVYGGKSPEQEPLTAISKLYQDFWARRATPRSPDVEGARRRDNLLFQPHPLDKLDEKLSRGDAGDLRLLPLDGLTYPQYEPDEPGVKVEVVAWNRKTNKPTTVFRKGDEFVLRITNKGDKRIYVELVAFNLTTGRAFTHKHLLLKGDVVPVAPNETVTRPPEGSIRVEDVAGKDAYTVFAAREKFELGVLLDSKSGFVADRILHKFYVKDKDGKRFDPAELVKTTIEVETVRDL
jgi:serine/threonine-protein kinase